MRRSRHVKVTLRPRSMARLRAERWAWFQERLRSAPEDVYRHPTHGWEYFPVHPFGDEAALLERLGMRPEQCHSADAWWGLEGELTLLQAATAAVSGRPAGLHAQPSHNDPGRTDLFAVLDAPYVTRTAFEAAMLRFVEAGFPRAERFRLLRDDPDIQLE